MGPSKIRLLANSSLPVLLIMLFELCRAANYSSTQPTWLPSPYFRANHEQIITSKTGNDSTPTYTFTFSSALSGVPNLAYGIKNYRGLDAMMNQKFEVRRIGLTASTFSVSIQIFGVTNLYVLTVAYIAIDPGFPHHLNSFDNVPVNYSQGSLVNISVRTIDTTTYTNYIDYSAQSAGNNYTTFQTPLTSNKIVLYISSLFILSRNFALKVGIDYQILNSTFYKWTATIDRNISIQRLHFSQIVYNEDDVVESGTYAIVYQEWVVNATGGYHQFPFELKDNMIMAITDFETIKSRCGFEYNWEYVENQGGITQGIRINESNPSKLDCGFDKMRSILFYIKTWDCIAPYIYFNLTDNQCQDNCADYYLANVTEKICQKCHYSCIECSQKNDASACTTCQTGTFRALIAGFCVCNDGYFDDGHSPHCKACSEPVQNCTTCSFPLNSSISESTYQTFFQTATWPSDILSNTNFSLTCHTCESPLHLNATSGLCEACTLSHCLSCSSLTSCSICNSSASALLFPSDSLCYICSDTNCLSCSSDDYCANCTSEYDLVNGTCILCNLTCNCNGFTSPMLEDGTCSAVCGDGLLRSDEECEPSIGKDSGFKCSDNCTFIVVQPFIVQEQSTLAGLVLFIMGLRVVGAEMLFVWQNFQLIAYSFQMNTFQLSFNIHGYSNSDVFPFSIPSKFHMFSKYNFMALTIIFVFAAGVLAETFKKLSCCQRSANNKICNTQTNCDTSQNHYISHSKQSSTVSSNYSSNMAASELSSIDNDFTVHVSNTRKDVTNAFDYTQKSNQNEDRSQASDSVNINSSKLSEDSSKNNYKNTASSSSLISSIGAVLLHQVLFDLLINCACIFAFCLTTQVMAEPLSDLLNFSSMLIICSFTILIAGMLFYCTIEKKSFGQNQLKFIRNKAVYFWTVAFAERVTTSIILATNFGVVGLYCVLAIKLISLTSVSFFLQNLFYTKGQKMRSIFVQLLHVLLLLLVTLEQTFGEQVSFSFIHEHFMEMIYLGILLFTLVITVCFYFREMIYCFKADQRTVEQSINYLTESDLGTETDQNAESQKSESLRHQTGEILHTSESVQNLKTTQINHNTLQTFQKSENLISDSLERHASNKKFLTMRHNPVKLKVKNAFAEPQIPYSYQHSNNSSQNPSTSKSVKEPYQVHKRHTRKPRQRDEQLSFNHDLNPKEENPLGSYQFNSVNRTPQLQWTDRQNLNTHEQKVETKHVSPIQQQVQKQSQVEAMKQGAVKKKHKLLKKARRAGQNKQKTICFDQSQPKQQQQEQQDQNFSEFKSQTNQTKKLKIRSYGKIEGGNSQKFVEKTDSDRKMSVIKFGKSSRNVSVSDSD